MNTAATIAALVSVAILQGCATAEASSLAAKAMTGCHSTRVIELIGGKWWDSSSARIECGPPVAVKSAPVAHPAAVDPY